MMRTVVRPARKQMLMAGSGAKELLCPVPTHARVNSTRLNTPPAVHQFNKAE